METMYDTLLQLPLFQGLAKEDFTSILGKVKLHFAQHKSGETLIKEGSFCGQLFFVLKGEVVSSTLSTDHSYCFSEVFKAPHLIEPCSLFGMNTTYVSTYVASTEVHTISINKSFVLDELFKYEIFRLNYMNMISNRSQMLNNRLWVEVLGDNIEARIINFIFSHVERASGKKMLKIKMAVLADVINTTRLRVSKALNDMQQRGELELHRGEIVIPEFSKLVS